MPTPGSRRAASQHRRELRRRRGGRHSRQPLRHRQYPIPRHTHPNTRRGVRARAAGGSDDNRCRPEAARIRIRPKRRAAVVAAERECWSGIAARCRWGGPGRRKAIQALSARGALLWEVELEADTGPSLSQGADGTIYACTDKGAVCALSPDGRVRWSRRLSDWALIGSVACGNGLIYAGSMGGGLYALRGDGAEHREIALSGRAPQW